MDGVIFKTYSLSDLLISQAASFEFLSSRYLSIKPAKTLSASSFDSSANAFPLTPLYGYSLVDISNETLPLFLSCFTI